MPKMVTIRQLAETAELLRSTDTPKFRDLLEADYRKGNRHGTLTQIRFGIGPSGRPTKRMIDCLDDGKPSCYDKSYELELVGLRVNGTLAVTSKSATRR